MAASEHISPSTVRTAKSFSQSLEYPFLKAIDAASIRVFLRAFDQYGRKFQKRAYQLPESEVFSDADTPVHLIICVNP